MDRKISDAKARYNAEARRNRPIECTFCLDVFRGDKAFRAHTCLGNPDVFINRAGDMVNPNLLPSIGDDLAEIDEIDRAAAAAPAPTRRAYHPLDKTPLQHDEWHYLDMPLAGAADELFGCPWPTRTLGVELANEIAKRQGERARRAFWEAHTTEAADHPWALRVTVCNALAELGITVSIINRRKS